jgi:hypothetical protein
VRRASSASASGGEGPSPPPRVSSTEQLSGLWAPSAAEGQSPGLVQKSTPPLSVFSTASPSPEPSASADPLTASNREEAMASPTAAQPPQAPCGSAAQGPGLPFVASIRRCPSLFRLCPDSPVPSASGGVSPGRDWSPTVIGIPMFRSVIEV